jgi:hypothetical protein
MSNQLLPQPLYAGQELWLHSYERHRKSQVVTVKRVGRIWAYLSLDDLRCDKSGKLERLGNTIHATLYPSEVACRQEHLLQSLWRDFCRKASESRGAPPGATIETIREIANRLELKI